MGQCASMKKLPKSNDMTKNNISGNDIQAHHGDDSKHENKLDLELYTGETIEIEKEIEDILFQKGRNSTCKIITKESNATGFFCKIPYYQKEIKVLFTNNHILNEEMIKIKKNIHFVYKLKRKMIEITPKRLCLTNQLLDYTIIEIFDDDGIDDFFEIENKEYEDINEIFLNEDIAIIQYPKGGPLKINGGHLKNINDYNIEHSVSTEHGSSGSPIILFERNFEIIGIHRGCNKIKNINNGIYIKNIIDDIHKNINEITGINSSNSGIINNKIGSEYEFKESCEIYLNDKKIDNIGDSSHPGNFKIKFNKLLTDISEMFLYCEYLTYLDFSHFNTNYVTNMERLFYNCYSLKSLEISHFETGNILRASYMFYNCSSLTSLNLSNFIKENDYYLIMMDGMFQDCKNLQYLNIKGKSNALYTNILDNTPENMVGCFPDNRENRDLRAIFLNKSCPVIDCSEN